MYFEPLKVILYFTHERKYNDNTQQHDIHKQIDTKPGMKQNEIAEKY